MHPQFPRPLVMATGVFDILHAEHIKLLQMARTKGAYLIVGINTDDSVRRLKGAGRPVNTLADRIFMLQALRCVDEVCAFSEQTPAELVKHLRPDILVKGHDYDGSGLPEASALKQWGGTVWIAPTNQRISTTQIINRIRSLP